MNRSLTYCVALVVICSVAATSCLLAEEPGPVDDGAPMKFTTTASGLKYKILRKSDGKKPKATGQKCPLCDGDLVIRKSKRGPFVGCANYPTCKYIDQKASKNIKPVTAGSSQEMEGKQ